MTNSEERDKEMVLSALSIQKDSTTAYNNVINECTLENVTTKMQDILNEEYEISKKLKNEALKRNIISPELASKEKINTVINRFSK